jgi:hypothetical protein
VRREVTGEERQRFGLNAQHYVELCGAYKEDPA